MYIYIYLIYIIHKNHIVGVLYPIGPSYPRPKNLMRSTNLPKTLEDCVPWDLMVWKLWQLNGSDLIGPARGRELGRRFMEDNEAFPSTMVSFP